MSILKPIKLRMVKADMSPYTSCECTGFLSFGNLEGGKDCLVSRTEYREIWEVFQTSVLDGMGRGH